MPVRIAGEEGTNQKFCSARGEDQAEIRMRKFLMPEVREDSDPKMSAKIRHFFLKTVYV